MGNTFTTTSASGATTMSIATARDWVRQFARNAGSSDSYTDADIDRAIQFAGSEWCRKTKNYRGSGTLTLTAGDRDLPAFPDIFRPDLLTRAWLAYSETSQATSLQVIDAQALDVQPTRSGIPAYIGFPTQTTGYVYPTPSIACTVYLEFVKPFESWSAGGSVTFGLPLEDMYPIVQLGAPAILQANEPEHAFTSVAWKRFQEAIAAGIRLTLGPAVTYLSPVSYPRTVEEERETL